MPGTLKGLETARFAGKQLRRSLVAAVAEIVKISATVFAAYLLVQENAQTAWIVASVVTAVRWIRSAMVPKAKQHEVVHSELLTKMANVQEMLKTPHFNARALLDQLYKVTSDGAVFSPWVLNLLDAKIHRET